MLTTDGAKKRLAIIWFVVAGFLFLLFVLQTLFGRYPDEEKEAWGWFLPNIMPALLLIVGTLKADAPKSNPNDDSLNVFTYRIALALSVFYFAAISLTIFLSPLLEQSRGMSPLQLLQLSNLFIGPLQGIVVGAIGLFFVKNRSA